MTVLASAILLFLTLATPAHAGPVGAAIGAAWTAIQSFAAISAFTSFLVQAAFSIGMSMLARALQKKPDTTMPGIQTEVTTSGGTESRKITVGLYATGGHLVAPPMSHGNAGGTPNAYLTYVIALATLPGVQVQRLIVDADYVGLGPVAETWGLPFTGDLAGHGWLTTRTGDETTAQAQLLATYGSNPDRPWMADMIGRGIPQAILTFKYNRERFNSLPKVRFEVLGIPLYDPRKDSTAGGSGAHRWDDSTTWERTQNNIVIVYNIIRGIRMPEGDVWGGECTADDLPTSSWFAAMSECDVEIALEGGGTEPQYRCGFEWSLSDQPADVIAELLKGCSGQMVDVSGVWKVRVGGPGLPVLFLTDDDVLISESQNLVPFPSLSDTWNGVEATYPEPDSLWEQRDAPARYSATLEAEDQGRRLVAGLQFPAVPYVSQVQRLMLAYIAEERRFRRHTLPLPPMAAILEPLDAISWTSARWGYAGKVFEVYEVADDLMTLNQTVGIRERDSADYVTVPADVLPSVPATPGTTPPAAQSVPGFAVAGAAIKDGAGTDRRPALALAWDGSDLPDVRGVMWEVRLAASGVLVASGTASDVAAGQVMVAEGILPDTDYEARARLIVDRATVWTPWLPATTPDLRIGNGDVALEIDQMLADAGMSVIEPVDALPTVGNYEGRTVYLKSDQQLYRWNGAAWTARVSAEAVEGYIPGSQIAAATLTGDRFVANTVTAGLLASAAVHAYHLAAEAATVEKLLINDLLKINTEGGGFSFGKTSIDDLANDGIYMGRLDDDGDLGFGFITGRIHGGVQQYIRHAPDKGLQIVNASHRVLLPDLTYSPVKVATSQTVTLSPYAQTLTLDLIGGGGQGAGRGGAGAAGGSTIVQLYDGATYTGVSWTAPGGAGGTGQGSTPGQASAYAAGGAGGTATYTNIGEGSWIWTVTNPTAGTKGSGGGGKAYGETVSGSEDHYNFSDFWQGGRASALLQIVDYDISGLTEPKLVIVIGAGGTSGGDRGAAGGAGYVVASVSAGGEIDAGVVPLHPTATGSFSAPASTTGGAIFPDLGAGLWVLYTTGGVTLELSIVQIDDAGTLLHIGSALNASFVSNIRPIITSKSGVARTIQYAFYRMRA